jgi:hypothetical protein
MSRELDHILRGWSIGRYRSRIDMEGEPVPAHWHLFPQNFLDGPLSQQRIRALRRSRIRFLIAKIIFGKRLFTRHQSLVWR